MIRSVHNKFNTRSNLTKLADNQLIAIPIIKVSNVAFKIRISDIGKVTDNNVRIFDCRFDIDFIIITLDWVNDIWIWCFSVFHLITPKYPIYLSIIISFQPDYVYPLNSLRFVSGHKYAGNLI